MARIRENMTEEEVVSILGQPDDVRTQIDPGGISRVHTKEIWCYGTRGHLSFPSLGCVYIDVDGRTQESFGGKGRPPKSNLFTKDELQNLLRLLDTTPGLEGYSYNPLPLIQIVNTLQPLGKEKALAVIGEYIRVSDEWFGFMGARSGLFLVLQVLFDLPNGVDPQEAGGFGAPSPGGPRNHNLIPRFPIALVDDIPMMLVNGYALQGRATPMEDVLEFFRVNGHFRSRPLVPANDPLAALAHLMTSTQWIYGDSKLMESGGFAFKDPETNEREKSMLMEQLLRLIDSVYRLPTDVYGNRLPCGELPEATWQRIVSAVHPLNIKWDAQQNMFVFQDGTHLPKLSSKIYRRQIWRLPGMGYEDADLVLERKSDEWVEVMVNLTEKSGANLRPATLILFAGDEKEQLPLQTFTFTESKGRGGGSSESRTIGLKPDTQIKAKLVIEGYRTNFSPILKP
jgi:hypothetical protein